MLDADLFITKVQIWASESKKYFTLFFIVIASHFIPRIFVEGDFAIATSGLTSMWENFQTSQVYQ